MSPESIITIVLAIIAIIATLFTKPIQDWLSSRAKNFSGFFQSSAKDILFRALLLIFINTIGLRILYAMRVIATFEIFVALLLFLAIMVVEVYLVYQPVISQLSTLESDFKNLKMRLEVIASAKNLELENIQSRWPDFLKSLSDKPIFLGISAFLQSSKPVHIENDTLLIGVPEKFHEVVGGMNFDKLTPQYQSFFGNAYKTKITVLKETASL